MTTPRIAIGGMQHETNTFAPLRTEFDHFEQPGTWPGLTEGDAILDVFHERNVPISGFLNAATHWQLLPLLWAAAEPAGYVTDEAFDRITAMMLQRLAHLEDIDGLYLDLHGAMVTESHEDGEAELLRRVRQQVGPDLPVVVSLDLHGNLSRAFFEHASAVTIYRTYPHLDMADTGARAQVLMAQLLQQGQPFCRAWRQLDYIVPITSQCTLAEPAQRLYRLIESAASEKIVSMDLALGFPPADIAHTGATVFAYGTEQDAVDTAANDMLEQLSQAESDFNNPLVPAREAVRAAMELAESATRPVIIADPQDNPGAGGMGDTTGLLHALLQEGARGAALSMLWDEQAAMAAHQAGVGAEIAVSLGCQYPDYSDPPVECQAVVEHLSDGVFPFTGPMYAGSTASFGRCACLRIVHPTADVRVVVGSVRSQNADQAMFRAVGVEPLDQKILVIKSAVHFLNDYADIAERVIYADALGANPCNLDALSYTRLRSGVRIGPHGRTFSPGN